MKKRSKYAQNRINYIVYSNPDAIRELIQAYGEEDPDDLHELVKATKRLVREHGISFISELLKHHPEKKLILEANADEAESDHQNFCGACGSSFNPHEPVIPWHQMTTDQIEQYYQELKAEAQEFPGDSTLRDQIELVWAQLKERRKAEAKPNSDSDDIKVNKHWIGYGAALVAGMILMKVL